MTYPFEVPVFGYQGYTITKDSDVISYKYRKPRLMAKHHLNARDNQRVRVSLFDGSQQHHEFVEELMMLSFIGLPGTNQYIYHIDGDDTNDKLENLVYSTATEFYRDDAMYPSESWKTIGDYEVSNYGRVITHMKNRHILVKAHPDKDGYMQIGTNGKTHKVHHLVLNAFIGLRPKGMEACHNDGNPANNHISNLRWDTHGNNERDKYLHGTGRWSKR